MVEAHRWAKKFQVKKNDIEDLTTVFLETETPLTTRDIAVTFVEKRQAEEIDQVAKQFKNTKIYKPDQSYTVEQKLVFPQFDFAIGTVEDIRDGLNPDYGDFKVIAVKFEDPALHEKSPLREFASQLSSQHDINEFDDSIFLNAGMSEIDPQELVDDPDSGIIEIVEKALADDGNLVKLGGHWFPFDLIIEVDISYLHLAEAVLDMYGGGPLTPEEILQQIGGLGDQNKTLQIFSMNFALDNDTRFDEVGPAGMVLWYLHRYEPKNVKTTPEDLIFKPVDFDRDYLTQSMLDLEAEINDEYSYLPSNVKNGIAKLTLIYPHRRSGTLPLSNTTKDIFPAAQTARIYIEFVDKQTGDVFPGWVVHEAGYVYGLWDYYTDNSLPIGTFIELEKGEKPGQIIINNHAHRARTEWIRVLLIQGEQIRFESLKRGIGTEYDDLMIVGVDNLEELDRIRNLYRKQNKGIQWILKTVIQALSSLSPQGTVHAKTIYSIVNIFQRCTPGLVFAVLEASPDFEDMGNHYWKISE
ncbi:hypothetical protein MASR2M15_13930 [Anaerolineales bacterium]